jgi:hypothetical protein
MNAIGQNRFIIGVNSGCANIGKWITQFYTTFYFRTVD